MIKKGLDPKAVQAYQGLSFPGGFRHVHLMHLDGFRSDLFKKLLEGGHLPHFAFLFARGKLSLNASTVDKSETMKIIQSYLTSKLDTYVVAWWQFSRENFQFKNYWIDLADMIDYAIGTRFPLHPSIYDVLVAQGKRVMAGFSLHRRGVPFGNYARAYVEGVDAALNSHKYLDQAHITVDETIKIYKRMAETGKLSELPSFASSLLAPADEFGHYLGVVDEKPGLETCYHRDNNADPTVEKLFAILDEDGNQEHPQMMHLGYFTHPVKWEKSYKFSPLPWNWGNWGNWGKWGKWNWRSLEFCIPRPELAVDLHENPSSADTIAPFQMVRSEPKYVLGMIFVDLQLGRLIETLRSIRFQEAFGSISVKWEPNRAADQGILSYLYAVDRFGKNYQKLYDSLFEHTLFVFTGDHGMVHSPKMIAPLPDDKSGHPPQGGEALEKRHRDSYNQTWISYLNGKNQMDLVDPPREGVSLTETGDGSRYYGFDNQNLPPAVAYPHLDPSWQVGKYSSLQPVVKSYQAWAKGFFDQIIETVKTEVESKYLWLFLIHKLIGKYAENKIREYEEKSIPYLTQMRLKGNEAYAQAEGEVIRDFYNRRVRLVYGGGALNNLELFLPKVLAGSEDGVDWRQRPSYDEIRKNERLWKTLKGHPANGLIFVRHENGEIAENSDLPEQMHIQVIDRHGNEGVILVRRDPQSRELIYGYHLEAQSKKDPLGIFAPQGGAVSPIWMTYQEWNQKSIDLDHFYQNPVAGVGSYLYSANPAIGDVTVMHSSGWNYGDNAGGHGGIHKKEKLTILMAAAPGVQTGELMANARYLTLPPSAASQAPKLVPAPAGQLTYPSPLDIAPTVLSWLLPEEKEGILERFALNESANGFHKNLEQWVARQRSDILEGIDQVGIQKFFEEQDIDVDPKVFLQNLEKLFEFIPKQPSPNFRKVKNYREDGSKLYLGSPF